MLVSRLVYVRWALYSLHGWLDQTLEVGVPLHKLEVETVPLHHIPRHLHHVSPLYVVVDVEGLCEGHVEKLHVIRSTDLPSAVCTRLAMPINNNRLRSFGQEELPKELHQLWQMIKRQLLYILLHLSLIHI